MGKVPSLMDEEVADLTIPQATWDRGFGGSHLIGVGRLVSHRSVHFHEMVLDLRRVLDMRPWIFYRNLIVFQQLSPKDDPLSLNLDWCPFFVHVHDLPYGLRTIDVIQYLGCSLGSWLEDSHIERDVYWFEMVRIRININITLPLKRALQLCSEERENFVDPGSDAPYGAWLRAAGPLRRLGAALDALRLTYVPHFQTVTDSSVLVQCGARIFVNLAAKIIVLGPLPRRPARFT
ncbi:hypothetical protein Salat_1884600 [Sesamum alatum]|uniref:Aminotransferase-like plant mobile domain-containing protein n=1 Tax=Sesamum alatum TaxID=300844 RepID=A0AAE2CI64_9LAMI|nr:hypothetical protein Salat_1884600 [Sesamum alatum]